MRTYQSLIQTVLERFEFSAMHAYMVQTNWIWGFDGAHVPSMIELRLEAERLLQDVAEDDRPWCYVQCGGFMALKAPHGLELFFIPVLSYSDEGALEPVPPPLDNPQTND